VRPFRLPAASGVRKVEDDDGVSIMAKKNEKDRRDRDAAINLK